MLRGLLLLGLIGHVVCGITDCLFAYTPNGKFSFSFVKEPDKMAYIFEGMSLKRLIAGMLLGVLALNTAFFGYWGLCEWMKGFSRVYGTIMFVAIVTHLMNGVVFHVFCGIVEWFYVRLGRTEEALKSVLEFLKSTIISMYLCYFGVAVFAVIFFIAVVTGSTDLPRWAAIFNILPIFLLISPMKMPAKGNIAGAVMFLGLFVLS